MSGEPEIIDSEELDRLFDGSEEDILRCFDMERARRWKRARSRLTSPPLFSTRWSRRRSRRGRLCEI
jgi:hypothetical protein